jgi:hypothetical protein
MRLIRFAVGAAIVFFSIGAAFAQVPPGVDPQVYADWLTAAGCKNNGAALHAVLLYVVTPLATSSFASIISSAMKRYGITAGTISTIVRIIALDAPAPASVIVRDAETIKAANPTIQAAPPSGTPKS